MQEFLQFNGMIALFFVVAMGLGYLSTKFRIRKNNKILLPIINSIVKIKSAQYIYRSQFIKEISMGWVFSAPINKNAYVPFRIGESLLIEAPCDFGNIIFKTNVIERKKNPHIYIIRRPLKVYLLGFKEENNCC